MMKTINGGITAPEGFFATGVACGLKKDGKKDLALVCSEDTAAAAGVFTTNKVKGHSLQLTMDHIKNGYATAIVINSGNANACVGRHGYEDAVEIASLTASLLECSPEDVLVGSTGVIGKRLDMNAVRSGIESAVPELAADGGHDAEEAIMTTDLVAKEIAVEFMLQGENVRIGGMAKGSGMIHPNMATMISVITSDVNITHKMLDRALKEAVKHTFNRISVDGDTSLCDMVIIMANGIANNSGVINDDVNYDIFLEALENVCTNLAKMVARDGEGATKLVEIVVQGAASEEDAYKIVNTIAKSPLVKTTLFGEDANWGRIINAAGYSGADFDPAAIDIYLGNLIVCKNGAATDFNEVSAKKILHEKEIKITVKLNSGKFSDRMWTCDFSDEYVRINGSYRS
jgi:glutamate N-acetyltransferase / amino-acid N-acetyltransferase